MSKALYWFRNNLRLHDNPSLNQALEENDEIFPVFMVPPDDSTHRKVGFSDFGNHRKKFLWEAVEDLSARIEQLGGKLSILQGDPVELITSCCELLGVQTVYASKEVGFNEVQEEVELTASIELILREDQFLINPEEAPFDLDKVPFGFSSFRKKVEKYWQPREKVLLAKGHFSATELSTFRMPEIKVNFDPRSAHPFLGGETSGLSRLKGYLWDSRKVEAYKFTRNQLIGQDFSSKFSAFLALGCLSPIQLYQEVGRYEEEVKQNVSTYWLKFEMLWREFFRYTSLRYGAHFYQIGGIQQKEISWLKSQKRLQQWINGETGDDFVNANMIELAETGFMSNRGRQNAASYLVHDMGVDWRWGADYFEKVLVDYDCASNWGNWMYVAGVGNDRRNHKFDTHWQAEKYDANGAYRDLWL